METRVFDTLAVVSAATGVFVCDTIDQFYDVLGFVLGEPGLMTHQMPGASRAAEPHLVKQFPWLSELDPPAVSRANGDGDAQIAALKAWCVDLIAERGEHLTVAAVEDPQWVRGNALQDLADIAGNRPVIGVTLPSKTA